MVETGKSYYSESIKDKIFKPLVSIIVPSYNQGEYIKETLESIFSQSYSAIEVCVVDGGSEDDTLDILVEYGGKLGYFMGPDKGYADALNKGFNGTTGDIIVIQNSDDRFEGEAIKEAVEFFNKNPEIGLIYSNNYHINNSGGLVRLNFKRQCTYEDVITSDLIFPLSSTFFRRSALEAIGGEIDDDINFATDYNIWLKMACKGIKMLYVNRFWSSFRVHGGSMNFGNTKGDEEKREGIKRLLRNPDYVVKKWRKAMSGIYFREGKKRFKMGIANRINIFWCCLFMTYYDLSLLFKPRILLRRFRRMGLM
jgi:glycosyltransferase involved in cell wall biosynthesis